MKAKESCQCSDSMIAPVGWDCPLPAFVANDRKIPGQLPVESDGRHALHTCRLLPAPFPTMFPRIITPLDAYLQLKIFSIACHATGTSPDACDFPLSGSLGAFWRQMPIRPRTLARASCWAGRPGLIFPCGPGDNTVPTSAPLVPISGCQTFHIHAPSLDRGKTIPVSTKFVRQFCCWIDI